MICVVPSPNGRGVMRDEVVSNIQEVRARAARGYDVDQPRNLAKSVTVE